MPSSKDAKKSKTTNRLSSGIEELDHILGGGFPARRLFLIEGAPGSGKTTLALQFLLAGAKNSEKGMYVTFSESEDEIRAVAESHDWTLDGIHLQELSTLGNRLKNGEQYTVFQPADRRAQRNHTTRDRRCASSETAARGDRFPFRNTFGGAR